MHLTVHRLRRRALVHLVVALGLLASPIPGISEPAASSLTTDASPTPALPDSALKIGGIFSSSLPVTERRNSLRLILHPHFGDLAHHDHLRIPFGLRYGITQHWEVTADTTAYLAHGLGDATFASKLGFSSIHLGSKLNLGNVFSDEWQTAVGIDFFTPVGHPPIEINDGMEHVAPYVTFSRHLENLPAVRIFWSTGVDIVTTSHVTGERPENDLGDSANQFSGGFVWDHGRTHTTLEASYATTRLLGDVDRDVFSLRPGFVWEVPPKWVPGGRARWLLGAGLRATFGPDGTDFGASMKVRVDANLKGWWRATFRKDGIKSR